MARTALEESLWNNQPQLFNSIEAGQETNLDSPSRDDPKPQVKTIHTPLTYLWPSYIIYSVHGWHYVETTQDRHYVSTPWPSRIKVFGEQWVNQWYGVSQGITKVN